MSPSQQLDHHSTTIHGREVHYAVRTSTRARHALLTMSTRDGLVVVVPSRYRQPAIEDLLADRLSWIDHHERRIDAERSMRTSLGGDSLRPDLVALRGISEDWRVRYQLDEVNRISVREGGPLSLVIKGAASEEAIGAGLSRWLSRKVRREVAPHLAKLAERLDVTVTGISIRSQRTLWASCSASGRISVNKNLLFLPPHLLHYVLLHELCHRREMNHSPQFWRLLEAADPLAKRHNAELHRAAPYVPLWAY